MNQLMNFLQAASNTAASNVSGPVDLIAEALRAAGVPVPRNALLSSEWMRERGLTAPVQQGASQVAGDTLGLLAPVAAAAKAPQIARGLLQVGENAAAPRTMNTGMIGSQRGAVPASLNEQWKPPAGFLEDDLFHGSNAAIKEVDPRKFGSHTRAADAERAFWATDSKYEALNYAQWATEKFGGEETINRLRAAVKKPLVIGISDANSSVRGRMLETLKNNKLAAFDYAQKHGHDAVIWPYGNDTDSGFTAAILDPRAVKFLESF